jgi:uncharacterized protein YecE (DUF72 family)
MESLDAPPRIFVGRSSLEGGIVRYARAFDLLEVSAEPGRHPRRPGLLEWRKSAGEHFVFSVVVPAGLAGLDPGPDVKGSLAQTKIVAEALEARWWLLRTPVTVTPTARSKRLLEALIKDLATDAERLVAWEPRGVWGDEEAARVAEELGVHLVRDLAREDRLDDDAIVYTRLRALGEGARIGAAGAERVAERLEGAEEACVVVEGTGAGRVRQVLRDTFASASAANGAANGTTEDFDEDDEDDEIAEGVDEEEDDGFDQEEF